METEMAAGSKCLMSISTPNAVSYLPNSQHFFLGCDRGSLRSSVPHFSWAGRLESCSPHPSTALGEPGQAQRQDREERKVKHQKLSWGGPGTAASPIVDLRCPIWASGTRSRIIRQASYTMVEGSNCIVFTTLPMLIFSERATMVAVGLSPLLCHLPEKTD